MTRTVTRRSTLKFDGDECAALDGGALIGQQPLHVQDESRFYNFPCNLITPTALNACCVALMLCNDVHINLWTKVLCPV